MMNELKKYIAPSAQVSIFDRDIVTASPVDGGTGDPIIGDGVIPDDFDVPN